MLTKNRCQTRALFTTLAITSLVTLAVDGTESAQPRQSNVVIFYIDDMAEGLLGCYGSKLVPTPHIDALADNGARFTQGYVTACMCAPSRAALMTGRYQQRFGHDGNYISMGATTQTFAGGNQRRMKRTIRGGGVVTLSAPYKGGWVAAIVRKQSP